MSLHYATIVSANYLAYAKVLAASLAAHMPGAALTVLLVERASDALRERARQAGLNVLFAEDLGLPDLERLAYKYDILELNTALKPSLLLHLLRAGHQRVAYVDPDIQFHGSADVIERALDGADIVLTPHSCSPLLDGARPSDVDFLRNGVFNLGFVAVRQGPQSQALLTWWESRCLSLGFNDVGFGTFVDQKWMDLAPAYFDGVHVLKHRGCNMAYWNLHERSLQVSEGRLMVDEDPLVFFHFSGVDPARLDLLSRHQTRHRLADLPIIADLVRAYGKALLEAGHEVHRELAYSFGTLRDGTPVTALMRRALLCDEQGLASDPFDPDSGLQRELRASGIAHGLTTGAETAKGVSTHNLGAQGRRLVWVNRAVRMLARLLGPERAFMLLSYAAVLTRESHFASVLMNKPLRFEHRQRR